MERKNTKEMVYTSIALSVWKILGYIKKLQNIPLMKKSPFSCCCFVKCSGVFFPASAYTEIVGSEN